MSTEKFIRLEENIPYEEFRELYDRQVRAAVERREEVQKRLASSDRSGHTPVSDRGAYCPECGRRYPANSRSCPTCDPEVKSVIKVWDVLRDGKVVSLIAEGDSINEDVSEADNEKVWPPHEMPKPIISAFHKRRMYPWRYA